MKRSEKIKCIAYHYGRKHQNKKAIEEMSELIKAICKHEDCPPEQVSSYAKSVIDEIADVIVMMEQLKLFYGSEAVESMIDKKIDRQLERICMGRD